MDYNKLLAEIQQNLLQNLAALHNFFEKNGIRYFVIGGTLLGAIRHRGFIPWDDDIDIGIPRPDYERFLKLATEFYNESGCRYKICNVRNDKGYFYQFSKSYDTQTTAIEQLLKPFKRGTWVDIFPLDGTFTNYFLRKLQRKVIGWIQFILYMKAGGCIPSRNPVKLYIQRLMNRYFPISIEIMDSLINIILKLKDFHDSEYVANLLGYWGLKEVCRRTVFSSAILLEFESISVYAPCGYDEYLRGVYGNYMKPPPPDKQKSHHLISVINLNSSYL